MAAVIPRHRFTLEDYYRMGEVGIFSEDDRVELIEGAIVDMAPIGDRHAGTVDRINHVLSSRLGGRAIVRVQNPISLPGQQSDLLPDVSLLRPRADFYTTERVEPRHAYLVIEVMDSTVARDRRIKLPLYARARIPQVLLVDLNREDVESHHRPEEGRYRDAVRLRRGEEVMLEAFPDLPLAVDDILGPPMA